MNGILLDGVDGLGEGIEAGDVIVRVGVGRAVFSAEPKLEVQIGERVPVVLGIGIVQRLANVRLVYVGGRVSAGGPEEEVRPVVFGHCRGAGHSRGAVCRTGSRTDQRRSSRAEAVSATVGEGPEKWIVVADPLPQVLVLIPELEGVLAFDDGEMILGSRRAGF